MNFWLALGFYLMNCVYSIHHTRHYDRCGPASVQRFISTTAFQWLPMLDKELSRLRDFLSNVTRLRFQYMHLNDKRAVRSISSRAFWPCLIQGTKALTNRHLFKTHILECKKSTQRQKDALLLFIIFLLAGPTVYLSKNVYLNLILKAYQCPPCINTGGTP